MKKRELIDYKNTIPPPLTKEYQTIYDMLGLAVKFSDNNSKKGERAQLDVMIKYITDYREGLDTTINHL